MILDTLFNFHPVLAVMGWDDLLIAVAAAVASKGAERAMSGGPGSSSSTTPITPPPLEKPEDPFSWFSQMIGKNKGGM